jgi:NAD+ synthase (glutamine-hydrolysing)
MVKIKPNKLRILAAQINLTVGDVSSNAKKHLDIYKQGQKYGRDLVVMPELSLTGYPLEDLLYRPYVIKEAMKMAEEIATQTDDTTGLLFGCPRIDEDGKVYNSAYFAFNGEISLVIDKTKLPNSEVFDEKRYFSSGTGSGVVGSFKGFALGIAICEDIWHENVAKDLKNKGAEAILSMNASPFQLNKYKSRKKVIKQRTVDTDLPVLYLNLVGGQDELVFDGQSFTWDPRNNSPTNIQPFCEESIFEVTLKRNEKGCYFKRGVIAEEPIMEEQVYKVAVLGTRDYFHKNGFTQAVLGLSGGVDSALVLAIIVDALGHNNITSIMMPYEYTADTSQEDAAIIAKNFNVKYLVAPIHEVVEAFIKLLTAIGKKPEGVTLENIQARVRGVTLMAISNNDGSMVSSTGNKSENLTGNCTLYGDMNGGFNPLKDMPKTLVFKLCNWLNTTGKGELIPKRIIERPPSAELGPNQLDTDTLPDYDILDPILELFVEKNMGVDEIVDQGFEAEIVKAIMNRVTQNEFKRRQAPPGIKITERSITKADWRLPLTNGFKIK